MNTRKTIYDKLFKEETQLAKHEVELALVDDIKKQNDIFLNELKKADVNWRAYQNYLTNADKPFKEMIKSRDALGDVLSKVMSLTTKVEAQAKELGLKATDIPLYDVLKRNESTANDILDTINSFDAPSKFQ
jgi:hypothetical protein